MRLEDILKLKVGDEVCDCKYSHHKIHAITYTYAPMWPLYPPELEYYEKAPTFMKLLKATSLVFMPDVKIYNLFYKLMEKFWPENIVDAELTLDDGMPYRDCSAGPCCDLLPHPEGWSCPGPQPEYTAATCMDHAVWYLKYRKHEKFLEKEG